ncbi:ABC transporter permease [uncultured Anaeromusa sp.]|uniref:ABC transporter permease n=1 Tax=uncultured Anaeromusa sp. TaxID=673273 RepID=UPI0029C8BC06|nr:ABC transporter permease [uncultured Anaeromusa sp.]
MINLAIKEISHGWVRYVLTGFGLGLLIGVTMIMTGLVRGMMDDALSLAHGTHADLWVVQDDTMGPYAESSTLYDDVYRSIAGLPGVAEASNVAYLTVQVRYGDKDVRAMVAGFEHDKPGEPPYLVAGRPISKSRYEAIADMKTGFKVGDKISIRRNEYTVVGLTDRMVSSGGDPVVFVTMQDAQEVQFQKDNTSIYNDRNRLAADPQLNRPGVPGLLDAVTKAQQSNHKVNAVLVRVLPGYDPDIVADTIRRWKHFEVYTLAQMEQILLVKVISNALRQLGMFMIILAIVSTAIIALIIYTMTMGKIKEIAVLKLIGAKNKVIAGMILQEAWGLGIIGFVVGKITATLLAPLFPKHVELLLFDSFITFIITLLICTLASLIGIRAALKVEPASAIGG